MITTIYGPSVERHINTALVWHTAEQQPNLDRVLSGCAYPGLETNEANVIVRAGTRQIHKRKL